MSALECTPLDAANLIPAADMWYESWRDGHAAIVPAALLAYRTGAQFRERLQGYLGTAMLGWQDERLVGLYILDKEELYQFFIAGDARGTGAAQALLAAAEADLLSKGHTRACLDCSVGNDRAKRFYEKSGWTCTGKDGFYAETPDGQIWLDAWHYEKMLTPMDAA